MASSGGLGTSWGSSGVSRVTGEVQRARDGLGQPEEALLRASGERRIVKNNILSFISSHRPLILGGLGGLLGRLQGMLRQIGRHLGDGDSAR